MDPDQKPADMDLPCFQKWYRILKSYMHRVLTRSNMVSNKSTRQFDHGRHFSAILHLISFLKAITRKPDASC